MTERKKRTLEFFEQLNEQERSEAIENFDENYSYNIPDNLYEAIYHGFTQTDKWKSIRIKILNNTYHPKQFDIDDICESVENENDFNCSWTEIHKIVKATYEKLKELGKIKE